VVDGRPPGILALVCAHLLALDFCEDSMTGTKRTQSAAWIVVGALVVAVGGSCFVLTRSPETKRAPTLASKAEAEGAPPEPRALRPRQTELPSPSVVTPPPANSAIAAAPPDSENDQTEPEMTDEERAAEREVRFLADGPRTPAASSRELGVRRAFDAPEIGEQAQLRNIECRASQCRLEVSFARVGADMDVIEKLFASRDAPFMSAGTVTSREPEAGGRIKTTILLRASAPEGWL
jgi:hypothetical protein